MPSARPSAAVFPLNSAPRPRRELPSLSSFPARGGEPDGPIRTSANALDASGVPAAVPAPRGGGAV
jgi:hypothetical protein